MAIISEAPQATVPYAELAKIYDTLLGDRFFVRVRRNFERLRRLYRLHPASAADVACGTGTFVRYLGSLGLRRVYGVDRSAEMLGIAISKNRGYGDHFLHQDFNSLRLPEPVNLITCNFDSLNYLLSEQDLLRALQRFHANLAPGGALVFDMITHQQPWRGERPLEEHRIWPGGEFRRSMHMHPRTGLQKSVIRITQNGRVSQEVHHQRAYPLKLILGSLRSAGFRVLGLHDFYTLDRVGSATRRVVCVALKV